jgi:capsular exopolysaccharide synthesis family protein
MTSVEVVSSSSAKPYEYSGLVDPRAVMGTIRRRRWAIVLTAVLVALLTSAIYFSMKPVYVATGRVALDRRTDGVLETQNSQPELATDSPSVDTEVQVLRSPAIADAVVDRLRLAEYSAFQNPEKDRPGRSARDRAVDWVQRNLTVARDGNSYAMTVSFAASQPQIAAKVVNGVIDAYIGGQKTSQYDQRTRQIALLRNRLGQLRGDLIGKERAIAEYRAGTNLIDFAKDAQIAQTAMQTLNAQLAQARAEQAAADARAAVAASGGGGSLPAVLESPAVHALRTQQAQLQAQRADLADRYGNRHPSLAAVDEQLGQVNAALDAEISRVRQGVISEAQIARDRTSSLQASINKQQGQLMAANNSSVHLAELERNADAARTLYAALLDRYKQMVAAQGAEQSKAYVISYARTPVSPSSPSMQAFTIGGALAAVLAAAGVALVLESSERGFLNVVGVEGALGIPVLASIPDAGTLKEDRLKHGTPGSLGDYVLAHPTSVFTEAFRSLRTSLKLGQDRPLARVIAITSAIADEGKTTTSICFARSAAAAGISTVLVDCDARHKSTSQAFAPDARVGLLEVLQKSAILDEALVRDVVSGAHVLPLAAGGAGNVDLMASKEMRALIRRLSDSYDLVVLECAPVLPVAEARAVSAMADAVLLVVRWRSTPAELANRALSQLNRAGARVLGATLTRVSLRGGAADLGDDVYYYQYTRKVAA